MLTPYQKRQKDEDFADQMVPIEKEQKKKVKKTFSNKCVSSQNHRYKKRRGRHGRLVGHFVSLPSLSGPCVFSRQAGPAAFHGVIQTIGKTPLTT